MNNWVTVGLLTVRLSVDLKSSTIWMKRIISELSVLFTVSYQMEILSAGNGNNPETPASKR